ncbi:integrase [Prolixibacter sp. SD074]|jgi:transposase|nr:integrase [Prolixibacter sp. SD074]GET29746.1 integrase [Prolixibacter sp. SD074]
MEFIMLKEILRLKNNGLSNLKISQSIGSSRTTVIKYLKLFESLDIPMDGLLTLSDEQLSGLLDEQQSPHQGDERQRYSSLLELFPAIEKELKRVGVTRWHLWARYKQSYPDGYGYSQFCHHFQHWREQSDAYMHHEHKAGDKLFVDFTGKKLHITDKETGEIIPVEVFVATLGASQKTYVQACRSQQVGDFIEACQNALHYFGGVPRALVTDNLKSAVNKSDKYEPTLNENFAGFGAHYQVTVLPARSYKPKDKALVEGAVKIVYHRIYAHLHDKEFYSLNQLNGQGIAPLLEGYNRACFQGKGYSRQDLFESTDKPALGPLPPERYGFKQHREAKAQKNCHVYLGEDKHYYSVPYRYIGQKVKVLYSPDDVEIYHQTLRIACHQRDYRKYGYSTCKDHLPSAHRFVSEWNPDRFKDWAGRVGPSCQQLVSVILENATHPEQGYKSCLGILSMAKKAGHGRMEKACRRAMLYRACNYSSVKNILEKGLDKTPEPAQASLNLPFHDNIRGKSYYN